MLYLHVPSKRDVLPALNRSTSLATVSSLEIRMDSQDLTLPTIASQVIKNQIVQPDVLDQIFDKLTILSLEWNNGRWFAIRQCECGERCKGLLKHIRNGHKRSCGCLKKQPSKRRIDLTGQRFARLVVIQTIWDDIAYVDAICDCGNLWQGPGRQLTQKVTRSCGCLATEYKKSLQLPVEEKQLRKRLNGWRRWKREQALPSSLTKQDIRFMYQYWGACCAICEREEGLWHKIILDHWIPVANKKCPGKVPENILPLCHRMKAAPKEIPGCNNSKYNKDPIPWLIAMIGTRKAKNKLKEIEAYFALVERRESPHDPSSL